MLAITLLLFVGCSIGHAWLCSQQQQRRQRRYPSRLAVLSVVPTQQPNQEQHSDDVVVPTKRRNHHHHFHQDMQRILQSYTYATNTTTATTSSSSPITATTTTTTTPPRTSTTIINRHQRPAVIQNDPDGTERILRMWNHLTLLDATNEDCFKTVLQALQQRQRLRWKQQQQQQPHHDNPQPHPQQAKTVCAADVVTDLWQSYYGPSSASNNNHHMSLSTVLQILHIYAVCATPRGNRHYADQARNVWKHYQDANKKADDHHHGEDENDDHHHHHQNAQATLWLLHATCWEQVNKEPLQSQIPILWEQLQHQTTNATLLLQGGQLVLEARSKSSTDEKDQTATATTAAAAAAAAAVGDLWQHMQTWNVTALIPITADDYSNAILAYSKLQMPVQAQQLLNQLIEQYHHRAVSTLPLIAFNGVITAWGKHDVQQAHDVLNTLQALSQQCSTLIPNAVSYNSVLHAYLQHSAATQHLPRMLELVQVMEQADREEIRPNCFTYHILLKAWLKQPPLTTSATTTTTMQQVELLLEKLQTRWKAGDQSLEPTNRPFNMVLNLYAKTTAKMTMTSTGSSHVRARALLERMKGSSQYQPDIISYTTVLECLAKSADPTAPEQALQLLEEAFDVYHRTGLNRPNLRTFTMTILTFAKNQGSVSTAQRLLKELVALYQETNDSQLRPNEYPYNYVLNCAANSLDDPDAFKIATETYQEMRKSTLVRPDSYTYAFWLKCCNKLLPQGELRSKCVMYAFDECKKEGMVTNELLTRLFQGSPADVIDSLLELKEKANYRNLKVENLPPSWSRNASRRRR